MQKVSEAMPALIGEAFRDAQEKALEERDAACLSLGQGVDIAYVTGVYARALITAYLSHPAVQRKVYAAFACNDGYPPAMAGDDILQAIGARKP